MGNTKKKSFGLLTATKNNNAIVEYSNSYFIQFLRHAKPKQIETIFNEFYQIPVILVRLWDEIGDLTGKTVIIPVVNTEVVAWDDTVIVIKK